MIVNEELIHFELPDQDGNTVSPEQFAGRPLVLYFYPKDFTPGCTAQACSYRDASQTFSELGISVIGISQDSVASHQKFNTAYALNFPILSDTDHQLALEFGVYKKKNVFGKVGFGVVRTTFIFDQNHRLKAVFEKTDPKTDADRVLAFCQEMLESV